MPADALVTTSAGIVLTPQSRNIPSPASEELIPWRQRKGEISHNPRGGCTIPLLEFDKWKWKANPCHAEFILEDISTA